MIVKKKQIVSICISRHW